MQKFRFIRQNRAACVHTVLAQVTDIYAFVPEPAYVQSRIRQKIELQSPAGRYFDHLRASRAPSVSRARRAP
jgi:hypothetical protein